MKVPKILQHLITEEQWSGTTLDLHGNGIGDPDGAYTVTT